MTPQEKENMLKAMEAYHEWEHQVLSLLDENTFRLWLENNYHDYVGYARGSYSPLQTFLRESINDPFDAGFGWITIPHYGAPAWVVGFLDRLAQQGDMAKQPYRPLGEPINGYQLLQIGGMTGEYALRALTK